MLYFIQTAIVTIIVSFISGLLLEHYKNLAPRILCNVRNGIPLHINKHKFHPYIITISNTSNKTIHELTLNIQSREASLKSIDTRITKGLKFDSSIKNNSLDFYIPFLSKGDEFSVTVYEENLYSVPKKPLIAIRSPDNFKEIPSTGHNTILYSLLSSPKNAFENILNKPQKTKEITSDKSYDFTNSMNSTPHTYTDQTIYRNSRQVPYKKERLTTTKKVLLIIVTIMLVIISGFLVKSCLEGTAYNASASNENANILRQTNDVFENADTNAASVNSSTNTTAEISNTKKPTRKTIKNNNSSYGNTATDTDKSSMPENSTETSALNSSSKNKAANTAGNIASENTAINSASENKAANSTNNVSARNKAANSTSGNASNASSN